MPNFQRVTPYLQMKDLSAAVRFFVEVLGFHAYIDGPDFAYVQRESAAVRLSRQTPDSVEERLDYGPRAFLFYVDVNDLAALVEEVAAEAAGNGADGWAGPEGPDVGAAGVVGDRSGRRADRLRAELYRDDPPASGVITEPAEILTIALDYDN